MNQNPAINFVNPNIKIEMLEEEEKVQLPNQEKLIRKISKGSKRKTQSFKIARPILK